MKLDLKFYGELRKIKNDAVVPNDEWMCFLAHDNAFADILPLYRRRCEELGCDAEHLTAVDLTIERVHAWRQANPDKLKKPDAKGEKLGP
jgi:hypothetical protein